MSAPEALVMEALRGFTENTDKWPGPRVVKIFVSSIFSQFLEERRQILETVGPELQSQYDDRNIEVEFVDMHYGCEGSDECQPSLLQHHIQEVRECHQTSKAGYFLCFIGGSSSNYKPTLPSRIEADLFSTLLRKCEQLNLEASLLSDSYAMDDSEDCYVIKDVDRWYKNLHEDRTHQMEALQNVQGILSSAVFANIEDNQTEPCIDRYRNLLRSPMEMQCLTAMDLLQSGNHPKGLIAIIDKSFYEKNNDDSEDTSPTSKAARHRLLKLIEKLKDLLPEENVISFDYSEEDPDAVALSDMRESVIQAVSNLIDASLSTEPDQGKGRKKTVQEVFLEHTTHLNICIEHSKNHKADAPHIEAIALKIIESMTQNYELQSRHSPILIHGPDASGKTTLLTHIYNTSETIFPKPTLRIIRFSAETPRSAYSLELLRVICQQMSIILKIPEGYLPKDASFDPLYINNWFQSLLRRCEELNNEILLILVDNVHRINPLECDIVTGLSWLPMILPKNVFFICTSAIPIDQLQLTPAQKEKFKNSETYYNLDLVISKADNLSSEENIEKKFDELEAMFGIAAFSKLAGYITCSEFGLTETELLELLMPTSNSDALISLADGHFNFSSLCVAKHLMAPLLMCKRASGRRVHAWRAGACNARARGRYLRAQPALRRAHEQLASLFFAQFVDDEAEEDEQSEAAEPGCTLDDEDALLGSTPFHSTRRTAAAFTQRHVEESWLHLLLAGDFARLKDLTVCNFDFLLAAVQTVTISYLRCILEHVRCYILDRDVELVYGAVKKASDILTRDPMQLGAQIIAWLRPAVARRGVLSALVTAAMAWCDGYDKPILVPLNGWLQPPIASTVRVLTVAPASGGTASSARLLQLAPSGQHLVMAPVHGDPQLWHMMSNSRVHTFKGHSGIILCMTVTKESQYLVTGSEDTTVIVWDLHSLAVKLKIAEHIAPVLCVAAIVSRSLVISGGEDSGIIVASLVDGTLVTKIDHHRGPVTGVKVIQNGDILVSCSHDGTVCSWATDTFTLLNTITTINHAPVNQMEVSDDSVFLVTLEDDNELHLRTFITGTDLHTLKRHKAKVKCFAVAKDCSRCVVCCADQRAHIYSMLSASLLRVIPAAHDLLSVTITDNDDFLLLAGGNRVTIYSFHTEDNLTNFRPTRQKKLKQTQSTTSLTLLQAEQSSLIPISCLEVSADGQLAATGCARGLIRVWQLSSHRLLATLKGHYSHVNCVAFSPNNLLVLSGSEDRTVIVWSLADHSAMLTFKGHASGVNAVALLADSRRALSAEKSKTLLWLVDGGAVLKTYDASTASLAITNNMKYAVILDGDKCARIVSLWTECGNGRAVSHAERVTCCALTADGLSLVTGSEDSSLKVWQLDGGKLAQVLVGHTDIVTCVAVSFSNKTQVMSGSWDCNLIVWDINTGSDVHLLSGHLGKVTCVKITGDGTIAISGSEDKTLIIWETKRGLALTSLQLHVPLIGLQITSDCSRIVIHLLDRGCLPIICLHNTPAVYVKIPIYSAPAKEVDELRPLAPKRPMRRLLKKEVSLDTYTWQKKYGHLTSAAMMAQVDERLKRRFSVSASMEEISKIQQEKNKDLGSQVSLGPEQAALAQSQHFDQLEALWNKVSPPRRRSNKSLSKQSSLIESRLDSSDEEHTPVEDQEHMVE